MTKKNNGYILNISTGVPARAAITNNFNGFVQDGVGLGLTVVQDQADKHSENQND